MIDEGLAILRRVHSRDAVPGSVNVREELVPGPVVLRVAAASETVMKA